MSQHRGTYSNQPPIKILGLSQRRGATLQRRSAHSRLSHVSVSFTFIPQKDCIEKIKGFPQENILI